MIVDEETLIAYVDGELPVDAERRFEETLSRDAALQHRVDEQRKLRASLRAAFAPMLTEEIPPNILKAINTAPASRQWRRQEAFRWTRIFGRTATQFQIRMAVGTAVAVIMLVAVVWRESGTSDLFANRDGVTIAQGALATALDTRLASDTGPGPQMGLSFRDKTGSVCRTFAVSQNAGIACRTNGTWQIATLIDTGKQAPADFHAAGSEMPAVLRTTISHMIAGDAFDATQERASRARGWK